MHSLIILTDKIIVDGDIFPKEFISFDFREPDIFTIYYMINYPYRLLASAPINEWTDGEGNPYENIEDLITELQDFLNTSFSGKISKLNSSVVPLPSSSDFTGGWEDVTGFESIVVAVSTDQDGSYTIQFSPDGVNQDSTLTRYYRTGQIEAPHRFTITRKFARIVFTNTSDTAQSFFRLQTTLGTRPDLNAPTDSTLSQDFDATVVRPTDYHTEVALGLRQGATTENIFGYNNDIDTNTGPEIIAAFGGTFSFLTTGEILNIESDSTDDTLAGTGAQRIIIWGVDQDWNPAIAVVEMNGTTVVTTTSEWIGINRVAIFKAGSSLGNQGNISISGSSSAINLALMPAGEGTSQQMIYYVPVGHKLLLEWIYFNVIKTTGGGQPDVTIFGRVYSDVATAEFEIFRSSIDVSKNNDINIDPPIPLIIGEKSIVWFQAETTVNNAAVRGRFSGELIRNAST